MAHGIKSKVVAITGAGKGLGRSYALYLAGLGARIVVNNRRHTHENFSSADQIVAQIKAAGGSAVAEYSSIEHPGAGEKLLAASLETYGRLDVVIANAGISEGRSFHKQSMEDFRQVVEINLMGTANILHPSFRHMYEQGHGCMIICTSVAGLYGEHGLPAYSSSKAALLGLMYSLSQEGASHGLRINALAPFATTQMTERDMPPALKDQLRPDLVAPLLTWLISDTCSLNGEIIISGAGKISRARMMESNTMQLPNDLDYDADALKNLWKKLEALPLNQTRKGALDQFARFLAD